MNVATTETLTLRWMVPYAPRSEFEDIQQRDRAAEWARRKCWLTGRTGVAVVSVTRGRKNLVVRVAVNPR